MKIGRIPTKELYALRRRKAMAQLAKRGIPLLLVSNPTDVAYLSGFGGDDSWLLLAKGRAWLITDGRFAEQAPQECLGVKIHVRDGSLGNALGEILDPNSLPGKLAVQGEDITLGGRSALEKFVKPSRIEPTSGVVSSLQEVKDPSEIATIRRAVRIAEEAFKSMLAQGKPAFIGRTERQIAANLEYRMQLAGADRPAFDTILAVGGNASRCHHRPGNTVATDGAPILIDWGAMVQGYRSDLTRVVFPGKIPPQVAEIYDVVLRAQAAGISAIHEGAVAKSADEAAREVVASAGYADRFVHGLGHGLGRQIHESLRLAKTSTTVLRAGMVVTVEPGIYLPGVAGVRIEDDIEVTATGRRRLSTLPRELKAMMLR